MESFSAYSIRTVLGFLPGLGIVALRLYHLPPRHALTPFPPRLVRLDRPTVPSGGLRES